MIATYLMATPRKFLAACVAVAFLSACQSDNLVTGENVGMLGGAALGGYLGSNIGKGTGQLAAIAAGTLLGAYLGGQAGKYLSEGDVQQANSTAQESFEYEQSGTTSEWNNPDTGHGGTVTPQNTYKNSQGQHCRDYTSTVTIDGRTEYAKGTACRQPDGTWRIVS